MTTRAAEVGTATIKAPSLVSPGTILVGADGSNDGLRAVDYAAVEAKVRKAPLHIVTAVPPATATAFGLALPLLTPSRIVAMSFCEPRSWTRVLSS